MKRTLKIRVYRFKGEPLYGWRADDIYGDNRRVIHAYTLADPVWATLTYDDGKPKRKKRRAST